MSTYSKRQTKKSLGITNVKGVSVVNVPNGKKFSVRYKVEKEHNGQRVYEGYADNQAEAANLANKMFENIYGGRRAAQKAGYWNN